MIVGNEATICCDIDDTLIFWDEHSERENPEPGVRVEIVDPNDGLRTNHKVHWRHVKFLRKQAAKGFTVVAWSASGAKWAGAVVAALDLEGVVSACLSKPVKYVDDHPEPEQILGTHIFLDPEGHSL